MQYIDPQHFTTFPTPVPRTQLLPIPAGVQPTRYTVPGCWLLSCTVYVAGGWITHTVEIPPRSPRSTVVDLVVDRLRFPHFTVVGPVPVD